jgi:hypothetical protein
MAVAFGRDEFRLVPHGQVICSNDQRASRTRCH